MQARWLLATCLLLACSDDEEGPFPPGTITPPAGEEVSCGEYTIPIGPNGPANKFDDEHSCIQDALAAGDAAVLVQHSRTEEGDPLRVQFRVVGVSEVEAVYDATRDNYSSGEISTFTCHALVAHDQYLQADDCPNQDD